MPLAQSAQPFKMTPTLRHPYQRQLFHLLERPVGELLGTAAIGRLYESLPASADAAEFASSALRRLGIRVHLSGLPLASLPPRGPLLIVANHPFGALEGLVLASLLPAIRPDLRIMANYLLGRLPELAPLLLTVNPFGGLAARRGNVLAMRQASDWLNAGGAMVVFPAGEVASLDLRRRRVCDPAWSPTIARLSEAAQATVVTCHFAGANGPLFHLAGLLHRGLRTLLLPRALLGQQGHEIRLRVGTPIAPATLNELPDTLARTQYLRWRTYLLAPPMPMRRAPASGHQPWPGRRAPPTAMPLAAPVAPALLVDELASLPAEARLLSQGDYEVQVARASQIPATMNEIARLRELSFREVGEGTGLAADRDRFDEHYLHLWVWHRRDQTIVGAYRLGQTDALVRRATGAERQRLVGGSFGLPGWPLGFRPRPYPAPRPRQSLAASDPRGAQLYTQTLFDYDRGLLDLLGPALELGRSFVQPRYQRQVSSLLLLWRGIGTLIRREPRYRCLFGPVSISNRYRPSSRQLLAHWLMQHAAAPPAWQATVRPRLPLAPLPLGELAPGDLLAQLPDMDALHQALADHEPQGLGVPVLIKHYHKLGARYLGFNVDPDFGMTLDGLLVVDLAQADPRQLARFLGPAAVATFGHGS